MILRLSAVVRSAGALAPADKTNFLIGFEQGHKIKRADQNQGD
jgi:hypothetical protein